MSQTNAVPTAPYADSKDEALSKHEISPMDDPPMDIDDDKVNMEAYRQSVPFWRRVWQDSFTQMMLLSMQAFCGPAMADAIAGKKKMIRVYIYIVFNSLQDLVVVVWQPHRLQI